MDKMKILILLALVAVVIWYFSQETKPALPFIVSQKPSILPVSLPKYPASLSSPSPHAFPATDLTDYGWLTDDNLEFILKNHVGIQAALQRQNQSGKVFHLRTDLANVYNAFYKAKTNQEWDLADFGEELERNKARYVLFPLRVNGNHWGLVILEDLAWEEAESVYQVWYTSSGGGNLETEKEQLEPFTSQICGVDIPIQIIQPKDRKSKGYECGVYVGFYVLEILEKGKLNLKRQYSSVDCQNFRQEWKGKIGGKWCKWD